MKIHVHRCCTQSASSSAEGGAHDTHAANSAACVSKLPSGILRRGLRIKDDDITLTSVIHTHLKNQTMTTTIKHLIVLNRHSYRL
jgi:hypothetical protein